VSVTFYACGFLSIPSPLKHPYCTSSMTLYFRAYETVCMLFGVIVVGAVLQNGTTNWLVGAGMCPGLESGGFAVLYYFGRLSLTTLYSLGWHLHHNGNWNLVPRARKSFGRRRGLDPECDASELIHATASRI
jgi:hypothetical protein